MKNIDKLLQFEEEHDILKYKFKYNNLLIWPYIRYQIFLQAIVDDNDLQQIHSTKESMTLFDYLKYFFYIFKFNPFLFAKKYNIVFFSYNQNCSYKKEGKWFNRITDYFANCFENETLILENSARLKFKQPRYFQNVKFLDFINVYVYIKSKFYKTNKTDEKIINEFIKYLKNNFPYNLSEDFYEKIKKQTLKFSVKVRFYDLIYKKLFKILLPKLVLIEDASYGGELSYIIKFAKDLNINVAEPEHGVIIDNGHSYNYAKKLVQNVEYSSYLPDYILTYGEFWKKNTRISSQKIIIGNPHFNYRLQTISAYDKKYDTKYKIILIISQGSVTDKMVEIAKNLVNTDKKYKIIFKLHPGEVPFKERYENLYDFENINVEKTGNIYDIIQKSDYVIGSSSLVLYEAVGLKKPIFIYKSKDSDFYVPENFGNRFKTTAELLEMIETKKFNIEENIEYFWAHNWEKNYKIFLENIGVFNANL